MNNSIVHTFLFLIIILFTSSICLNAQGYIIQNDGTQQVGEIKQQSNYVNEVGFKLPGESKFTTNNPSDIKGFYKDGFIYHSLIDEEKGVHGFYQLLAEGTVHLYEGFYDDESITFYAVKNNVIYELNQTIEIVDNKIIKKPNYLSNLKQISLDQVRHFKKVDKLEFRRNELIKFIKAYNIETGNYTKNPQFSNSTTTSKFSVNLNYHSTGVTRIEKPLFNSLNYGVGLNYHLFIKYNFHFSLGAKFSFHKSEVDISSRSVFPSAFLIVEGTALQIPLELNYLLGNNNIKPKLKLGLAYTKLLKKDLIDISETFSGLITNVRDLGVSSGVTISLGTGVNINDKMYLDLIFSNTLFGIGGNTRIDTQWRTFTFSAGYYFN